MNRDRYYEQLQKLDPHRDHCQICHLIAGYEFPWDVTRALEIALFRTFCVPSISQLLDHTGEFRNRPQKRYDDTGLIVSELMKWGHESPQGTAAINRMNRIHQHFPISNDDYLYVLSTFVYEPIRWINRFGWRALSPIERLGWFYFWRAVGEKMQIQGIPSTDADFEQFSLDYEHQYFRYSDSNHRVGEATRDLFLSWFPALLRPVLQPCVYTLLDDTMLMAFGFPRPSPQLHWLVTHALKGRGTLQQWLPPRQHPDFYVDTPQRSYPQGYQLQHLGPPHLLDALNRDQESAGQ